MPFTAKDCELLTGTDRPTYYTTPSDWRRCKNLNLEGATPCWHPHCDCMGAYVPLRSRGASIWEGFMQGLAAPANFLVWILRGFR